jgi:hypothetical protein
MAQKKIRHGSLEVTIPYKTCIDDVTWLGFVKCKKTVKIYTPHEEHPGTVF